MALAELHSTAIPLADSIEYQAGSVVSREILRKDTGTVTLFAFSQGQGLSEHTAPFDALVYILDGEAKITIAGSPAAVKAGEMIIMPANEPHALQDAAGDDTVVKKRVQGAKGSRVQGGSKSMFYSLTCSHNISSIKYAHYFKYQGENYARKKIHPQYGNVARTFHVHLF
jgi:quercetin dioxygenase-like cupin family protein